MQIGKKICAAVTLVALIAAVLLAAVGTVRVFADKGAYAPDTSVRFTRETDDEYSEDTDTVCPVRYVSEDGKYSFTVKYTYSQWESLGDDLYFDGYVYRETGGDRFIAFAEQADSGDIARAVRDLYAEEAMGLFMAAISMALVGIGMAVITFFGRFFNLYEKCWFMSVLVLASAFSILFPEESANGVSGIWIMSLYLADTFLNILCELLISKQSKWNFIVSVLVELTEILMCIVLAYRFATMATTLFFWLPCDIISFINWHRKPDRDDKELTRVRSLKGWQEAVIVAGIVVWTAVIGYILSGIDLTTDLFGGNKTLQTAVCYLDACVSAVGIVNGLAILFRFREQWIAWYISALIEAAINILAGQYMLLILKLGYLTNTTYGYIKWTGYIKGHPEVLDEKTVL